ncbi:DUF2202 domain-containing protein [Candidatus Kaiserbacteria bacterium]|nr:DUF2202 domain-containing protein [Candidatus Kaiserbacteria bacterium]
MQRYRRALLAVLFIVILAASYWVTRRFLVPDLTVPLSSDTVSLSPRIDALPKEEIDDAERADLLFVREEEKLARDIYTQLAARWQLRIFDNIAQSEQAHTDAVRALLERYEIADPAAVTIVGEFADTELAALYAQLIAQGGESEVAALKVGALVEEFDIADLTARIAQTDNEDIRFVYENLLRGSRNHLRLFAAQLTARGQTYAPQYISTAEYGAIISSQREVGGRGR